MTQVLLTTLAGLFFLVGSAVLFTWMDERAQKRSKQKVTKRFKEFDELYYGNGKELENRSETKRKERAAILGYNGEPLRQVPENIDVVRYSGRSVV